jgi:excisionase family DNA binding protein
MEELFTVKEVAQKLKVAESTINRWVAEGKLKAIKLSEGRKGAVRFRQEDIERFINNQAESK